MNFVKKIDENLNRTIDQIVANKRKYVKNPGVDFTRKRKLPMQEVLRQILSMSGGSLTKEMYEASKRRNMTLTASAFVQQRQKIHSSAFKEAFYHFNSLCSDTKTYRGYRLIAVDGTKLNCPRNSKSEYFFTTSKIPEGLNQVHLTALYDIRNKTYVDLDLLTVGESNEQESLIKMLYRNVFNAKTIIIADRGFEGYNMFAHFINTDKVDFLCRVKNALGGLKEIKKLPMEELDIDLNIAITTTQTKEDKKMGRIFIQTHSRKGKQNSPNTHIRRWDFPSPYVLKFRVVRFLLDSGEYETLVTSLPREVFSIKELKNLYHERWGVETSFRDLKYPLGLTHLHSKTDDLIRQEIYAATIMYNYCSRISGSREICLKQTGKHAYKVNFAMAIHICKKFFISIKKVYVDLIYDICRFVEPIRPGRKDKRNVRPQRFVGFSYRVAA